MELEVDQASLDEKVLRMRMTSQTNIGVYQGLFILFGLEICRTNAIIYGLIFGPQLKGLKEILQGLLNHTLIAHIYLTHAPIIINIRIVLIYSCYNLKISQGFIILFVFEIGLTSLLVDTFVVAV